MQVSMLLGSIVRLRIFSNRMTKPYRITTFSHCDFSHHDYLYGDCDVNSLAMTIVADADGQPLSTDDYFQVVTAIFVILPDNFRIWNCELSQLRDLRDVLETVLRLILNKMCGAPTPKDIRIANKVRALAADNRKKWL